MLALQAKKSTGCLQSCDLPAAFSVADSLKNVGENAGVASASLHSLLTLSGCQKRRTERERERERYCGQQEEEGTGGGAVLMLQPTPG